MPFSPQPKKKGKATSQEGKNPSCDACAPPAKIIDLPTEKKKIATLQEKVFKALAADPQAAQKAALILSAWINKKR